MLAVCALHNVAIKNDGTLWTWGDSAITAAVAPNSPSNHYAPVQLGTDTNWVAVAAGYYHTIALKSDGTLWDWGRNSSLLGTIPAKDPSQPRQLGTNTDWVAIYPGGYHNLARKRDGSIWQLGHDVRARPGEVTQIQIDFAKVAGGADFNIAVAPDGSIWHWGVILGVQSQSNLIRRVWNEMWRRIRKAPNGAMPPPPSRANPAKIFQLPIPAENRGQNGKETEHRK